MARLTFRYLAYLSFYQSDLKSDSVGEEADFFKFIIFCERDGVG